jgi:hypothetical protein
MQLRDVICTRLFFYNRETSHLMDIHYIPHILTSNRALYNWSSVISSSITEDDDQGAGDTQAGDCDGDRTAHDEDAVGAGAGDTQAAACDWARDTPTSNGVGDTGCKEHWFTFTMSEIWFPILSKLLNIFNLLQVFKHILTSCGKKNSAIMASIVLSPTSGKCYNDTQIPDLINAMMIVNMM